MAVYLSLFAGAGQQFFTNAGVPLAGGKIYTYGAGGSTPLATYTTSAGNIAHSNPIVLDSSGRVPGGGEVWLTSDLAYKFVLQTSASVTIQTLDNVAGGVDGASLAASSGSSLVGFIAAGAGAVARTAQSKMRDIVSIADFGADSTGLTDSTTAFNNAQVASKNIYIPPGTYLIDNLRILDKVQLIGAGYENTILKQKTAGNPAINCLSDVTTGQLSSLKLSGFKVEGATGATVAAVLVSASGVYAIWKSEFDFVASSTYRALEIQAASANNVFRCDFKVSSQDTSGTAVLINGGTYNTFDLFMTNCANGRSLDFTGLACFFIKSVSDGQQKYAGSQTVINNATVEEWYGTGLPAEAAITCQGFTETFVNPMVILNATSAARISYAFRPFDNTVFINPKVLAATFSNPFQADNAYKFSIVGPGQSTTINKMESIFTDLNNANLTLRRVSFIGDCSQWVSGNLPAGGKVIQYQAPAASPFSETVRNNIDAVVWEPTGVMAVCNLTLPQIPVDNQVLSVSTTQAITTINVSSASPSGVDVSLVPTTMAANSQFSIIYRATNNKWYRI